MWRHVRVLVSCILQIVPSTAMSRPYITAENKVCTRGPGDGICIYGQCCEADGTSDHSILQEQEIMETCQILACERGDCMRRAVHPVQAEDPEGEVHESEWWEKSMLTGVTLQNVTEGDYVRYCKCPTNYFGERCEEHMNPAWPIVYALLEFGVTTKFLYATVQREYLIVPVDRPLPDTDLAQAGLHWAAAAHATENFMMGIGVFSGAVAWSRDWVIVKVLRFIKNTLLEFLESLCQLMFPHWTARDTFRIQILFSAMGPILLIATAWAKSQQLRQDGQAGSPAQRRPQAHDPSQAPMESQRRWQPQLQTFDFGSLNRPVFVLLPLLIIPVVGTLFNPIVSCNLNVEWLSPEKTAPGQTRPPTPQDMFEPESMRKDCSWGSSESYFEMGVILLIPFHIGWFVLMMNADEDNLRHPLLKGYTAWHAQLLVSCAMAYQAFKNYHPKALCFSLACLNGLELRLLWKWQPCRHQLLNDLRIAGATLAVVWSTIGFVATLVHDPNSDISGVLLMVGMLSWCGWVWRRQPIIVQWLVALVKALQACASRQQVAAAAAAATTRTTTTGATQGAGGVEADAATAVASAQELQQQANASPAAQQANASPAAVDTSHYEEASRYLGPRPVSQAQAQAQSTQAHSLAHCVCVRGCCRGWLRAGLLAMGAVDWAITRMPPRNESQTSCVFS